MSSQLLTARRKGYALLVFLLLVTVLVACGGPQQTPQVKKNVKQVPLTIVANTTDAWTKNFNPYSSSAISGAVQGTMFETLLFFNRLNGDSKPWLAKSYDFASDATNLTFHLQPNVKWSDGQPFTSADVAFTLEMIKKNPTMDAYSISSFIESVSTPDASTVVIKLNKPFTPILWYLGGQVWMLPKHKWSSVTGDPTQFANPEPVGTGPFTLKSFDAHMVIEVKNPNYWQPGKPVVNEIRFPTYSGNETAELALIKGDIQWTGLYIPNIQNTYVKRDTTHNHYWFPTSDIVMLYSNLKKAPFDQLAVRQAISAAVDRERISKVAESGFEPVANPTGLVLPASKDYLLPEYTNLSFSVDTAKATQLLETAGFTKGSDGIYADKNGKKLSFKVNVVEGWTDWISTCQIIAKSLESIGMKVEVNVLSYDAWYDELQNGKYDTSLSWTNAGPSPYYIYDGLLRSTNSAPLGQPASSNFGRWEDATTDQLLNQYATSLDKATQQQAIAGLQKIMVEKLPAIPLMNEPYWYEWSTTHYTGWSDEQHPYAVPSPFTYPDNEMVLLNLQPV